MLSQHSHWPAGEYDGPLLQEKRHGNGIMTFRNGNKYHGEFVKDQFDGAGEYIWADGRTYVGEFKGDKIQGKGIAHWPDGRVYDGEWIADLADGHGMLTMSDSRVFEGIFRNDFPVLGQMIEVDGTTFLANFDGSTHASEWHPCRKSRVGKFHGSWVERSGSGKLLGTKSQQIREFYWDDGRRFAGICVGYCPVAGVVLESNCELLFVRFDGNKTFAQAPAAVSRRKLDWEVRPSQNNPEPAAHIPRLLHCVRAAGFPPPRRPRADPRCGAPEKPLLPNNGRAGLRNRKERALGTGSRSPPASRRTRSESPDAEPRANRPVPSGRPIRQILTSIRRRARPVRRDFDQQRTDFD